MRMQDGDVLDRLSIVLLKLAHANKEQRPMIHSELVTLWHAMSEMGVVPMAFCDLALVNAEIWELESDIRKGNDMPLEEVGRRALLIRDANKRRVEIRNKMMQFKDIKMEHASA